MRFAKQLALVSLVPAMIGLALTGCGSKTEDQSSPHLNVSELKQLVKDFSTGNKTADSASITSSKLTVTEDGRETAYDLPGDAFFVSIAPYVEQTHPCATHNLAGCQGELKERNFSVTIRDSKGNAIMNNSALKSEANGFIDLWLPRNDTYQVSIQYDGQRAESEISTYDGDNTCITTMKLD